MAKNENKEIKKAIEIIEEMSMDPKEWELYESREKAIMNYNSGMKAAERRGIEKGIEKGKRTEKIEIVKKLLGLKLEIEKIVQATGMTKEEIEKIKLEIEKLK